MDEPVISTDESRLFEAVIRAFLTPGEQHISTRQPDVSCIAPLFNGGIRKRTRGLEIADPSESNRLGRQQLRITRKTFERLIGPHLCLMKFSQLNEHSHLPAPGHRVCRIKLEHFCKRPKPLLKLPFLKAPRCLIEVERLIL